MVTNHISKFDKKERKKKYMHLCIYMYSTRERMRAPTYVSYDDFHTFP